MLRPRRHNWFPCFVLLALACVAARADGRAQLIEYRSPLDGSVQVYGVYLPDAPPPTGAGYPVVLHGHGYGWSVSARFSSFQKRWAEEHGWIIINLNARGPNFYEGVGDVETLNVIEDAAARFGIDRDRIYFTGGSMGGTGALRQGLRHPDVFAAVMGVDGWTDYRLWHWHWYARKDARDLIEEFRRPLLEAASPLYWATRGRWGATGHIVDGRDTVVLPENGLQLRERLYRLGVEDLNTYDQKVVYNPTLGHGRGNDYQTIYDYFLTRARTTGRGDFLVQTTVLPHGELYWGRIERFHVAGLSGWLEGRAEGRYVTADTGNLDRFTLLLKASPSAGEAEVEVWADGFRAYAGPPVTVTLEAERDAADRIIAWRRVTEAPRAPAKTPGMCGPVGDAFLRPFAVAWGTMGEPAEVARHRAEAEQFARSWNAFMVHGPGVTAVPEDELTDADLTAKTLVIFGTIDTSRLLHRANLALELPVQVRRDRIIVRDPVQGDRRYVGEQFGALMCYPNPLNDLRTYLVVCNRRIYTKPDSKVPQLLGYDLEKLPWAYPDWLVFNNDQDELPFTLNVNNKPPVTCYEAAQFVEAGYFDDRWRVNRGLQLRRVCIQKPEPHKFVHIADLTLAEAGNRPAARVRITDSTGEPAGAARVTGRWWGDVERVRSAVTDEQGWCAFPAPVDDLSRMSFEVVNVMATGATYDWTADRARLLAPGWASPAQLRLTPAQLAPAATPLDPASLTLAVMNAAPERREVVVRLVGADGRASPERARISLDAGGRGDVRFTWRPGGRRVGLCRLRAEAAAVGPRGVATASCVMPLRALPPPDDTVALTEVKGADMEFGQPWSITVKLTNLCSDRPVHVTVRCAILEAGRYPEAKTVQIAPGSVQTVTFVQEPGTPLLERGEYTVRAAVDGARGVTATGKFAVR
ncbi:MAG: prolyl oligopeptidase family serine peptidase [Armatimonadetes bacterium]|nr:prolyl oligopeptidase family serine peptidase [Armatimonadota bacterium]